MNNTAGCSWNLPFHPLWLSVHTWSSLWPTALPTCPISLQAVADLHLVSLIGVCLGWFLLYVPICNSLVGYGCYFNLYSWQCVHKTSWRMNDLSWSVKTNLWSELVSDRFLQTKVAEVQTETFICARDQKKISFFSSKILQINLKNVAIYIFSEINVS